MNQSTMKKKWCPIINGFCKGKICMFAIAEPTNLNDFWYCNYNTRH